MRLPSLTDSERAYLHDMRALSTDREGREIFVGLDREESEWLHAYLQNEELPPRVRDQALSDQGERYLKLHDKHELVRLAVVGAEGEARLAPERH